MPSRSRRRGAGFRSRSAAVDLGSGGVVGVMGVTQEYLLGRGWTAILRIGGACRGCPTGPHAARTLRLEERNVIDRLHGTQ